MLDYAGPVQGVLRAWFEWQTPPRLLFPSDTQPWRRGDCVVVSLICLY
jgi:hypothetical protein